MSQLPPSSSPYLKAETTGPVATITFDKAVRRNAFDTGMWRGLGELVTALGEDSHTRVMVLRGAGTEAFSAGADISEFAEKRATPEAARAYDAVTEAAFGALRASAVPSIAKIHGFCLGGGLGLALSCDLRIASDKAVFAIPAAKLGLAYPFASLRHLVATAGADAARELIFTGRRIGADEARALGLVNRVVEADGLDEEVADLAAQIAANAPLTIGCAKAAIEAAMEGSGEARRGEIERLARACYESDDYREGRAAFLEKRRPVFRGV